jgi:hypothetical protein
VTISPLTAAPMSPSKEAVQVAHGAVSVEALGKPVPAAGRRASMTKGIDHIQEGYLSICSPSATTSNLRTASRADLKWSYRFCTWNMQSGSLTMFAEKSGCALPFIAFHQSPISLVSLQQARLERSAAHQGRHLLRRRC